jgi:hypothetical protein
VIGGGKEVLRLFLMFEMSIFEFLVVVVGALEAVIDFVSILKRSLNIK